VSPLGITKELELKVRLKFANAGTFYGHDGVGFGDVVEIPDDDAKVLIQRGQVERVDPEPVVERATARKDVEEHATVKPVYGETHPPEDAPAPATKRGPGRPRKVQ